MINEGDKLQNFELPRDGGGTFSPKEFKGSPLVLFFYPKDNTSGCTKEAIGFSELKPEFDKHDTKIIGFSPDPVKSHDKFIAKHDLKVILASDEEKKILEQFGVWVEKKMYGRTYMGVERSTFLINGTGRVARVWRKVKVAGHVEEVLEAVDALKG